MKNYFFLLIGFFLLTCCTQKKEESLDDTISKVVKAFKEKDEASLYEFISKELGVITLFKDGAHTTYLKTNTLSFKSPNPENWPYHWPNFLTDYKLLYETLPKIDCGELLWEKTGIYCDTTKTDHL